MNCTYCGECDLIGDLIFSQEGASCATDISVSTQKSHGILQLVGRQFVTSSMSFSEPPTQRKTPCLFSYWCILGKRSNATKGKWEIMHAFIS